MHVDDMAWFVELIGGDAEARLRATRVSVDTVVVVEVVLCNVVVNVFICSRF